MELVCHSSMITCADEFTNLNVKKVCKFPRDPYLNKQTPSLDQVCPCSSEVSLQSMYFYSTAITKELKMKSLMAVTPSYDKYFCQPHLMHVYLVVKAKLDVMAFTGLTCGYCLHFKVILTFHETLNRIRPMTG